MLLYDEPTTGLDPIVSDVINELIMRTRDQNAVTSIVVTHDMKTAQKVADRVVMLYPLPRLKPNESQIIFDGTPAEILECKGQASFAIRPRRSGRTAPRNGASDRLSILAGS